MYENPAVRLEVITDDGDFYVFPFLRLDPILRTSTGPMVRQDWLDDLGIDEPETIADWENMLIAFNQNFGAQFSGVASQGNPNGLHTTFATAWGLRPTQTQGFNVRPGTQEVFFSFSEPSFREYWETMMRWYAMGLIDEDVTTRTRAELDGMILREELGAFIGPVGGGMGPWLTNAHNEGLAHFDILAPRFPVLNAGDPIYFQGTAFAFDMGSWGHAAITSTAERNGHVEVATRWLDWAYSQEGFDLLNWGEEGLVWENAPEEPGGRRYTTYISQHPDRTFAQALSYHALSPMNAPFVQDGYYMPQFAPRPQQRNALQVWNFGHNAVSTLFPPVSFTEQEADTNRSILPELQSFYQEQLVRWLHGTDELNDDTWNAFINQMNNMGLERVLAGYQAAANRFWSR